MIREMKSLITLLHRQVRSWVCLFDSQRAPPPLRSSFLIRMFARLLLHRCWELKRQGSVQRPPPSPLTSPISLMSYSPPMNFFNTSSSSVTGRTEPSSALSPRSPQSNDDPESKRGLQSQWEYMDFRPHQKGNKTMSVCTVVDSIPKEAQISTCVSTCVLRNVSFHQSHWGCTTMQPVTTIDSSSSSSLTPMIMSRNSKLSP